MISITTIYLLLTWLALASTSVMQANAPNDIVVSASIEERLTGYLDWGGRHPGTFSPGKPHTIGMPTLDLYSPSGISIYYGEDSATNAAFLGTLPQGIPKLKTVAARPSLKEAIEMLPQLKAQEGALLADKRYTLFAATQLNSNRCKAQNEAIANLRKRAGQMKIRIIEVRLHQ